MKRFFAVISTVVLIFLSAPAQNLKPFPLFGDNMVLQRDKAIIVYGTADPGSKIKVTFQDTSATSLTGEDGNWEVDLASYDAGGPYQLEITSGSENLTYDNVMVGDVWIASGQSNMGYQVKQGVLDYNNEVAKANYPGIRYFEVAQLPSQAPQATIPEFDWKVCTPENVPDFSAVAYYFAQKINQETGIPVGIINTSWGGSSIEAWMSPEALAKLPHLAGPDIQEALKGKYSLKEFNEINNKNIDTVLRVTTHSFEGLKKGVQKLRYDDSDWKVLQAPDWGKVPNQVFWLRKSFELNQKPNDSLSLSLGVAGSIMNVYLNGREVIEANVTPAMVTLSPKSFSKGPNIIAIRLANPWWYPYIQPGEDGMALRDGSGKVLADLSGDWKYSADIEPRIPQVYSLQTVPSALFNGMLSPLFETPITGVIWYQGENNGDQGIEYRKLFTTMISEWRILFHQGYFPFLYVQLANLGNPTEGVENSGWPYLREAQDMALYLPYTGMATAIDVGNQFNIHPKDKKTVGYRLALNALYMTYHKQVPFSGPHFRDVKFNGSSASVSFDFANGLVTNNGAAPESFCMAGPDQVFYKATAKIFGNTIELTCPEVPNPVAVRYAWAKNPVINLYNGAGLPALPFRTDDWPPEK